MIKNKSDYRFYVNQDMLAHRIEDKGFLLKLKMFLGFYEILRFQKLLRKVELYHNVQLFHPVIQKTTLFFYKVKFNKLSIKLGYSIPPNVFGPGLAIIHYGTIIVNSRARVGANCRIHACTNIGESGGKYGAPTIGDNVYMAPGVKIYGDIKVADNIAFAANAAVGKDCLQSNSVYGGVPAKRIGQFDIQQVIKHIKCP